MDKRQKELASQCNLTLVTEADCDLHTVTSVSRSEALCSVGINDRQQLRYDLVAVPSFRKMRGYSKRVKMLIEDVVLALDVHSVERVVVLHNNLADVSFIQDWFNQEKLSRFDGIRIDCVKVPSGEVLREPSERLAVTCMDFRLHHRAGLHGKVAEPSAWLTYPGAAFAGIDSQISDLFFSDLARVIVKEQVRKVTLISHTDCAKYAAKYFWQNEEGERKQLAGDLRVVAMRIRGLFSGVDVLCAIAKVQDGIVKELIPIV